MPCLQVERAWLLEDVTAIALQTKHSTGRMASATISVRLEFPGIRGGNGRIGAAFVYL
jgi:hypothetical protein